MYDNIFKPHAPTGLSNVLTYKDSTGTMANNSALRLAFLNHHTRRAGHQWFNPEVIERASVNDTANYKVISFTGSQHGSSLDLLSLSSTPQKTNLPMHSGAVVLDFPSLKYPYDENSAGNRAEEEVTL